MGKPKIYLQTFGCTYNKADSEIMKGLIKNANFQIVERPEDSDVILVNTCYVKLPTEQRVVHRILELQKNFPTKKLIVAGCMVEIDPIKLNRIAPNSSWVGPHQIAHVVDVVKRSLSGKRMRLVGEKREVKVTLPKLRENPIVDIVQISEGCNGHCSYCCTKLARKRQFSYPKDLIRKEVEAAIKNGCKEIWITAQDTAAYGRDIDSKLPELLNTICELEGKFFVRVGMANPLHVKEILDELIEAYQDYKIFKFLHLPVQSGSNMVLNLMKRGYEAKDFLEIVKKFKKAFPKLTISTDVIVGFPGETEEDFLSTTKLLEEVKPDVVNLSKFGARKGTEAAKMKQLEPEILKERSFKLSKLIDKISFEKNKEWEGWKGEVLVDEIGKAGFVGRNFAYKPIVLKTEEKIFGEFVEVEVKEARKGCLFGEIL